MTETADQRTGATRVGVFLPLGFYIVGLFVFFRDEIFSRFDMAFGSSDGLLAAFLHEHVYRALGGHAALLSPPFFFNQTKTLGYTDAFVLNQVAYAPLRLMGAEPLLAYILTPFVLSAIAYLFFYLFLRRFEVSVPIASLAALIFTFANNLYMQCGWFQHFAVYYTPIVAYCGLLAVCDVHRRPARAYLLATFAAGLYGLMLSTGYYMGWFFGLGLLIFTPIAVSIAWPQVRTWWRKGPRHALALGLAASLGFLATLAIFLMIYGPVLATGVKREFFEYLEFAPEPMDIINVGNRNMVWGGLIQALNLIDYDQRPGGTAAALTPVIQILLALSVFLAFRPRFWPPGDIGRISRAFVIAGASVCALFYLFTIEVHDFSLFQILYAFLPGANAIRVGYRGMVAADLFAVTAVALTLDRMFRSSLREPRPMMRVGRLGALTAILALAALEQVNLAHMAQTSRKSQHELLSAIAPAPSQCRAFYAVPQDLPAQADTEDEDDLVDVQTDAMMIALAQHLPTVNGRSGLLPPGWNLQHPHAPNYEYHVERWVAKRGIAEGLCRVDLDKGTWTVPAAGEWICAPGSCVRRISFARSDRFEINLKSAGNSALFTDDHWADPEPEGQWTTSASAALSFAISAPRNLDVELSIRPLLSAGVPKQSVWIDANGCRIDHLEFDWGDGGSAFRALTGAIPAGCVDSDGKVALHINTDHARSPKDIGINGDTRPLGVFVQRVVIRESGLVAR